MVMNGNRRSATSVALTLAVILGACAVGPRPRSYPERPFTDSMLGQVRVGMPADSLVALFGQPDTVYEMTFGARTDREWKGVAYRYYAAKDRMYRFVDAWKKNTFYFFRSPTGLVLNHWVVEHEMGTMNGKQRRP